MIGHIAFAFNELEFLLKLTIYELADVDEVVGRLAIGTARVEDQVTKIEDLLTIKGLLKTQPPLATLKTRVAKSQGYRDKIVHGLWAKDDHGNIKFVDTIGKLNINARGARLTKRMFPTLETVTATQLSEMLEQIRLSARWAQGLYNALHALRGKFPSQVQPGHQNHDQNGSKL